MCQLLVCFIYTKKCCNWIYMKKKTHFNTKKKSFLVIKRCLPSLFVFIKLHIWQLIFCQSYTHFDLYNSDTISECLSTTSSYVECPWYSKWFKVKFNCFLFIMIKWQYMYNIIALQYVNAEILDYIFNIH